MKYNFDHIVDRTKTNSRKWDSRREVFNDPDVLPMWIADMDFPAPPIVVEALIKRAKHGVYGYPCVPPSYFDSIIGWYQRRHHLSLKKEWINYAPGIVSGISFMVQAFSDPGDKIIFQPPVYHPFPRIINFNNRQPITNKLKFENSRYHIDFDDLERKAKSGAKCMILCNPHNPVGRVWSENELLKIIDICQQNNIVLISDEIHCDLIYEGHRHISTLSLVKGESHNIAACFAPSKVFNLAGLKDSSIIIPNKHLRKKYMSALNAAGVVKGNIFGIDALEIAYRYCDDWLEELLTYLQGNLEFAIEYFESNIKNITLIKPQGTYLLWLDCRKMELPDNELKRFMVNQAKVGFNAGSDFGIGGEGFMRMNIGCPRQLLSEALHRLKNATDKMY